MFTRAITAAARQLSRVPRVQSAVTSKACTWQRACVATAGKQVLARSFASSTAPAMRLGAGSFVCKAPESVEVEHGWAEPEEVVHSVFVSNLAYTVTAQQVKQFFEDNVGGVSGVSLFYRNDMPTGSGLVRFFDPDCVTKALQCLDMPFEGRPILVREDTEQMRGNDFTRFQVQLNFSSRFSMWWMIKDVVRDTAEVLHVHTRGHVSYIALRNPADAAAVAEAINDLGAIDGVLVEATVRHGLRPALDPAELNSYNLVVTNVPRGTAWQQMKDLIKTHAKVDYVSVDSRARTAWVKMAPNVDVGAVVAALDQVQYEGQTLSFRVVGDGEGE